MWEADTQQAGAHPLVLRNDLSSFLTQTWLISSIRLADLSSLSGPPVYILSWKANILLPEFS